MPAQSQCRLPWCLSGKESTCRAGDVGSIPGSGISPGEGNGNPLQVTCLGNPMDRGVWSMGSQRVVHDLVTKHQQQHQWMNQQMIVWEPAFAISLSSDSL